MTRLFAGTPFDHPPRCERCGELEAACECGPVPPPRIAPEKQTAKLRIEKRKRGKTVTVIGGLAADGNDLPELLRGLKSACGAGGTIQDDCMEIQGDHLERAGEYLKNRGYRVTT